MYYVIREFMVLFIQERFSDPYKVTVVLILKRDTRHDTCMYKEIVVFNVVKRERLKPLKVLSCLFIERRVSTVKLP